MVFRDSWTAVSPLEAARVTLAAYDSCSDEPRLSDLTVGEMACNAEYERYSVLLLKLIFLLTIEEISIHGVRDGNLVRGVVFTLPRKIMSCDEQALILQYIKD